MTARRELPKQARLRELFRRMRIDGSSVLAIGGPSIVPQSGETMVAFLEARRVASCEMKLLDHKRAAQRPPK